MHQNRLWKRFCAHLDEAFGAFQCQLGQPCQYRCRAGAPPPLFHGFEFQQQARASNVHLAYRHAPLKQLRKGQTQSQRRYVQGAPAQPRQRKGHLQPGNIQRAQPLRLQVFKSKINADILAYGIHGKGARVFQSVLE
ncbi:MAG: hypothetical protein BWY09_01322 [Candidatus Hydrogenedentes bacterium ADurb.Bin179]|nr:MAG: hypothetical protein BWY09_01322 [Candidatus Hydrogenedentes bacterium ADurb.Bin179]